MCFYSGQSTRVDLTPLQTLFYCSLMLAECVLANFTRLQIPASSAMIGSNKCEAKESETFRSPG